MTRREAIEWQCKLFPRNGDVGFYPTLPEICMDVRSACRGDADGWDDETIEGVVGMLQARLETWQDPTDAMDEGVYLMVEDAIRWGQEELQCRKGSQT